MIKVGWVYGSRIFHIINEETKRTECNLASLNEAAAEEIRSGSVINTVETVENLEEMKDKELRLCSHCKKG